MKANMKSLPVNAAVKPSSQPRKKFDLNFKTEAVNLWLQSGRSAQAVAAELGLRDKQLYLWKQKLGLGTRTAPPVTLAAVEAQNAALRRENEYLRHQRDILKKTLGILSEPPSNATNALTR